jgi:hypothetical protein
MSSVDGLFNVPGVSFWIQGQGEEETVRIRIRWKDAAAPALAEKFGCDTHPTAIASAIVAGLRQLFGDDEVRELAE